MCGEKTRYRRSALVTVGSPPRMRGKDLLRRFRAAQHRITPACAGKRNAHDNRAQSLRDHPRVCGEKGQPVPAAGLSEGSPPRMRGKVKKTQKGIQSAGITPACAGKSLREMAFTVPVQDHPRTCGEKAWKDISGWSQPGSPPHMRGKDCVCRRGFAFRTITPAHAGKRHGSCHRMHRIWDHPRTCGEKTR